MTREKRELRLPAVILGLMLLIIGCNLSGCLDNPEPSKRTVKWSDLERFRTTLQQNSSLTVIEISSCKELEDYDAMDALVIIAGIETNLTEAEREVLSTFISRGGSAIIAQDHGYFNTFAAGFGVHFTGHVVYGKEFDKNISFVKLTGVIDGRNYQLLANRPIGLTVNQSTGPYTAIGLIETGREEFFMDLDDDEEITLNDTIGPFMIAAEVVINRSSGSGPGSGSVAAENDTGSHVVFLGDTGFFIDDMWHRYQNAQFIEALIHHLLPNGGKIFYDRSKQLSSYSGHILYGD